MSSSADRPIAAFRDFCYAGPMPLNQWSETILIIELSDEPSFSEDMDGMMRRLDTFDSNLPDVIVDLRGVTYLNSTNISQLLRLRKRILDAGRRLRVCDVSDSVWTVFLLTGLDQLFEFTDDVTTSLASLQINQK